VAAEEECGTARKAGAVIDCVARIDRVRGMAAPGSASAPPPPPPPAAAAVAAAAVGEDGLEKAAGGSSDRWRLA
jgi:hypothetical protein